MKTIELNEQEASLKVISQSDICYVGMVDKDNTPYVIPMNFGYQEGVLYLHSGPTGSCIDILNVNSAVCITFSIDHELVFQHPKVACSYRMKAKSAICRGKVLFIEDMEQKREALNIIMRHYSDKTFEYSDPAVSNVKIWKVPIESMTAREYGVPHK